MRDIVEKLYDRIDGRASRGFILMTRRDLAEAADEINRLRSELASANRHLDRLCDKGAPFAEFSSHAVDDRGWTGRISKERICDWFGPSDFADMADAIRARAEKGLAAAFPFQTEEAKEA